MESNSEEDLLLRRLKVALSRFPDPQKAATRVMRESHRYSIRLALGARGDPFARTDAIILSSRNFPDIRVLMRELPVTIGSSRQADHVIQGEDVAGIHCRLEREGPFARLSHAESGIFPNHLNGRRMSAEYLSEGDKIRIGSLEFLVKRG